MKKVKINKKKLMREAWQQASFGKRMYGGNKKMYFASSLKLTWQAQKGLVISFEEVKRLEKEAKQLALSIIKDEYAKYDAIWTERIKITPALLDHGKGTVNEILKIMPNLLVYCENCQSIDEMAQAYDFSSANELIDYLLAYKPRKQAFNAYHFSLFMASLNEQKIMAQAMDECPF